LEWLTRQIALTWSGLFSLASERPRSTVIGVDFELLEREQNTKEGWHVILLILP
jgi:hypothetical protein